MQGSASGGAQSFRRERICGAADAGSGGGGPGRAEGGSGAQDRPHVAGILHTGQYDEQGSAGRSRSAHEIIEGGLPWMNQRGHSLWVFGVGEAFEEAVGGAEDRKCHFGPVDQWRQTLMMAFTRLAEENGPDCTAGTKRLFNQARSFDADEAIFCG